MVAVRPERRAVSRVPGVSWWSAYVAGTRQAGIRGILPAGFVAACIDPGRTSEHPAAARIRRLLPSLGQAARTGSTVLAAAAVAVCARYVRPWQLHPGGDAEPGGTPPAR